MGFLAKAAERVESFFSPDVRMPVWMSPPIPVPIEIVSESPRIDPAVQKAFDQAMTQRSYAGAEVSRLDMDWYTPRTSADAEIYKYLWRLRARSRGLERDSPYPRKFFNDLGINVLGPNGPEFEMQIVDDNGKPDKEANLIVLRAWNDWCENYATVDGDDFAIEENVALRSVARDGDVLTRMVTGFDNPYGFALQSFEADNLDEFYQSFQDMGNGHQIRMGVEVNEWMRPVAYHVLKKHPGDVLGGLAYAADNREIFSSETMLHPFVKERVNQSRGVPWFCAAIIRLRQLNAYEEAEVIAARCAANKMGYFTKTTPEGYTAGEDEQGNPMMASGPGMMEELPIGFDVKTVDWNHPNQQYPFFVKAALKGIASSIGVSYTNLASDLEGVNYSSIRQGTLSERDMWMYIQAWWIRVHIKPIFRNWLKMGMLTRQIKLPFAKFEKFCRPVWKPRRWSWVDPEKEVNAELAAIKGRIKSRRASIMERGGSLSQVDNENREDSISLAQNGLIDTDIAQAEMAMYGNAMRSGLITPNKSDESYYRFKFGLPAMSKEVIASWDATDGVRLPITIQPAELPEEGPIPPDDKSKGKKKDDPDNKE